MNNIDKMPVKCRDCAYWEIAREPYVCTDCESRMERLSDLSKPKPTDDYIKRSDALKAILGVSIYDTIEELEGARTIAENTWADGLYDAYKIIEEEVDAVDVEPKRKWIPVTERLPEEPGEYIVAYHPCYWDVVGPSVKVGIDNFRGKTAWAKNKHQRVIAWQEKPEPPKEEDPV